MSTPPYASKKPVGMSVGKLKPPRSVKIVESEEFERDADAVFPPLERRALHLALAENPLIGEEMKKSKGLRKVMFSGYFVVYAVSPDLDTLFLLVVDKEDETSEQAEGEGYWKKIKSSIGYFLKGGLFGSGKKLVDWLIDQT